MKKAARAARKKQIIHLYSEKKLPITEIAKQMNVTRQAVYEQLARAGIATSPRTYTKRELKTLDYQLLYKCYVDLDLPVRRIVRVLQTSAEVIERELKRHNIEHRPWQYRPRFPSEIDGLEVGDSRIIVGKPTRTAYCRIYSKAGIRGMKVKMRRIDGERFRVTRIS